MTSLCISIPGRLCTGEILSPYFKISLLKCPINRDIECDYCDLNIIGPRLACITCQDKNLNNGVDFCSACIGRLVLVDSTFVHSTSHTLLRCDNILHDASAPGTFVEARLVSARIKVDFRNQELAKCESHTDPTLGAAVVPPGDVNMLCACCGTVVTTPCWACLDCGKRKDVAVFGTLKGTPAATFLICLNCNADRLQPVP